jgi:hypothetical protein
MDIDTTYQTTLEANWIAMDPHSGIATYEFAVGTIASGTDVQDWTSNGSLSTLSYILMNPIYDQVYYISVRALNGADLNSEMSTDGQRLFSDPSSGLSTDELLQGIKIYPNPTSDYLLFENLPFDVSISLYTMDGKLVLKDIGKENTKMNLPELANGIYNLVISKDQNLILKKIEIYR